MLIEIMSKEQMEGLMINSPVEKGGPYEGLIEFSKYMAWGNVMREDDGIDQYIEDGRLFYHCPSQEDRKYVLPGIMKDKAEKELRCKIEFDRREHLSMESIEKIIDGDADSVYDELIEYNEDYMWATERELIMQFVDEYDDFFRMDAPELYDEIGFGEFTKSDRRELADSISNFYNLGDFVNVYIDLRDLAGNTVAPMLVEMVSNYDCVNSCHFEGGSYEYPESYVGDAIDAMNLNPRKLAEEMSKRGMELRPSDEAAGIPDMVERDGNEIVSYSDFCNELSTTTCGANLLTFLCRYPLDDMVDNSGLTPVEYIVKKGTPFMFYSSLYGGCGICNGKTVRDFEVSIKRESPYSRAFAHSSGNGSYGPMEVFGCGPELFGDEVKVISWGNRGNA